MAKFIINSHETVFYSRLIEANSMEQALAIFNSDDEIGEETDEECDLELDSIDEINEEGEIIGGITCISTINDN
jgi:hypothetical protein